MKQTASESGIQLLSAPHMSTSPPGKQRSIIYTMLLALLGINSTFAVFLSMFDLQVNYSMLIGGILLCWVVSSVFCIMGKRWTLGLIPTLIGGELLLVKYWSLAVDGYCYVFNTIYQRVHFTEELRYTGLTYQNQMQATTALLLFCMLFLGVLTCFFTIARPNAVICFVLTGALPEIGLYYGVAPSYPAFACLLAYWVGILAQDRAFSILHLRSRRMHQYHAKEPLRRQVGVQTALTGLVLILVLFSAVTAGLNWSHFSRSEQLDAWRMQIKSGLKRITLPKELEVDTPAPSPFKFAPSTSTPDTFTLGRLNGIRFTYEPMVQLRYFSVPDYDLYLKSYVGSKYENNTWSALTEAQYQRLAQMQSTGKTDSAQTMLYQFIENRVRTADMRLNTMEISPVPAASDIAYIPYPFVTPYDTNLLKPYHDGACKRLYPQSYSVEYLLDGYVNFNFLYFASMELDENPEQLNEWEPSYQKFVYDSYLDVPDTEAMQRVQTAYADRLNNDIGRADSYASHTDMVLREVDDIYSAITENCTYTLTPGPVPTGRELIEYFLLESHQGYCAYFATAGVMLCRMAGIPARYVEGVAVSQDMLSDASESSGSMERTLVIDDSHAHAWAEIYLNGIGWIPYDFTPGGANSNQLALQVTTAATTTTTQTTTHVTTTVPVHTQTSTADSSTGTQRNNSGSTSLFRALLLILTVLAIAILLPCGIWKYLHRRANEIWKKRTAVFASGDTNAAVIGAYQYLLRLLKQMGLTPGNETPTSFAARAEEACPYLSADTLTRAASIAEYADLSEHTVSEEDREFVTELAMQLQKAYGSDCTRFQQFRLRFLWCLIQ